MGNPPGMQADHKTTTPSITAERILRVCTRSQNNVNRQKPTHNTSGYKGVSWNKQHQKWRAEITHHGKKGYLGYYTSRGAAAAACDGAAEYLFGEFALLNVPRRKAES